MATLFYCSLICTNQTLLVVADIRSVKRKTHEGRQLPTHLLEEQLPTVTEMSTYIEQTDTKFVQDLYESFQKYQLLLQLGSDMRRGASTEINYLKRTGLVCHYIYS